jgi:hypothetical protein
MVYSLQEEFEDTKEAIGVIQVVPIILVFNTISISDDVRVV